MIVPTGRGFGMSHAIYLALGVAAIPSNARAADGDTMDNFTWAVVIGVALIILVAFAAVRKALLASSWSLADALSEDVTLTGLQPTGEPEVDATGKSLRAQLEKS